MADIDIPFADGEVLDSGEIIVHDLDDAGNVIGWHKVPAEEK